MIHRGWIPVWKRNRDVFYKMFLVNFFLPILEPVFYLFAFGYGLGGLVKDIGGVPYRTFILPAIVCMASVNSAFFYTTYSSFVKMIFQKTFDAIIATPVGIDEVVVGEIMWGATRGVISAVTVLAVFLVLGLLDMATALCYLPLLAVLGFTFSSLGMFFTAVTKNIESFNYPIFLYFTPMIFFSGTFFPLSNLPDAVVTASRIIFPLTTAMEALRSLHAEFDATAYIRGYSSLVHGIIFFFISLRLMRKKLIT